MSLGERTRAQLAIHHGPAIMGFGSKLWGRHLFISFGAEAQGQGPADEPVIGLVFSIQHSACRLWLDVGQSKLKKEIDVAYLLIMTTHQDAEWAVVVSNLHAMGVGGAQWSSRRWSSPSLSHLQLTSPLRT